MATVEESRKALERLTARISDMNPDQRAANLADRTLSCEIPDLGVTFLTRLGPDGADPIREASDGDKPAQVRFTANSDLPPHGVGDWRTSGCRAWRMVSRTIVWFVHQLLASACLRLFCWQ